MPIVYAALFIAVMGGAYAGLYYLNHKTPVPKGCEDLSSECQGCSINSCEKHPNQQYKEGEQI